MEIDTEIDTETNTEIFSYGDIVVANVATSPIRSRLPMTRWQRRSASAKRWVVKDQPLSRPASGGGEAAVAVVGAPQSAVAVGEAAVAAHDEGASPALKEARSDDLQCRLSGSDVEGANQKRDGKILPRIPSVTAVNSGDRVPRRFLKWGPV